MQSLVLAEEYVDFTNDFPIDFHSHFINSKRYDDRNLL